MRREPPTALSRGWLVATLVLALSATADAQDVDFVRRLVREGYADLAIDFLDQTQKQDSASEELAETIDLERGNALRTLAEQNPSQEQSLKLLGDAEASLKKFRTDHPDHNDVARAIDTLSDIQAQRARVLISQGRSNNDKVKQAAQMTQARQLLEEAKRNYKDVEERFRGQLAEIVKADEESAAKATPKVAVAKPSAKGAQKPAVKKTQKIAKSQMTRKQRDAAKQKEDLIESILETRFNTALCDYNIGLTYVNLADPKRAEALKASGAGFDEIWQFKRGEREGLYAHMWHGRVADEMGDLQTAEDIYDEVLANAPEPGTRSGFQEFLPLFAEVKYFRLIILRKKGNTEGVIAEAEEWLKTNAASRQTRGYSGVLLELAQAQIKLAENDDVKNRKQLFAAAMGRLTEVSKLPTEHRREAFLLMRKYHKETRGADAKIASFEEGIAVGDSALSTADWKEAIKAYSQAIELGKTIKGLAEAKEKKQIDQAERVNAAKYFVAFAKLRDGQAVEAIADARKFVEENEKSKFAPQAGALAVNAALAIYSQKKTPEALEELQKAAQFVIDKWALRPEADEARIAIGQATVMRGDIDGGIAAFEKVDPKSTRYGLALHYAGQTYWRKYFLEKQKPPKARDAAALEKYRETTLLRLRDSLALQTQERKPNEKMSEQFVETQYLLAEALLESSKPKEAIPLFQALVDQILGEKPKEFDQGEQRIFAGALRAYVSDAVPDKAGEIADQLAQFGPDTLIVNNALVEYCSKSLSGETKKLEEQLAGLASADENSKKGVQTQYDNTKARFVKLLQTLTARKQSPFANLVYAVETRAKLDPTTNARQLYQDLLAQAEADPASKTDKIKMGQITRIRVQLISLLRNEEKYDDALSQLEALLSATPNSLELLMEKGRVLRARAEKDQSKFGDAIGHWSQIRKMLLTLRKKPPEYYEVIANLAETVLAEGGNKDAEKAKQAEQLLKSTMVLNPNLSGPEMVERYNALLKIAVEAQGRTYEAPAGQ